MAQCSVLREYKAELHTAAVQGLFHTLQKVEERTYRTQLRAAAGSHRTLECVPLHLGASFEHACTQSGRPDVP
jgi:hypothetical protein